MLRRLFPVLCLSLVALGFVDRGVAQSSNLQFQVANLVEDFRLLDERMRSMTAEMDELRRENAQLRSLVQRYEAQADQRSGAYATVAQVNQKLQQTVAALEARDEVLRKDLVNMVSDELSKFGTKITKVINNTVPILPPEQPKRAFPKNFPDNGTVYTVVKGDTLASIADKLKSRVDWIQNANKIADPRLIQVGQVIFVPQQ